MSKTVQLNIDRKTVSSIDGNRCVNCGQCEEICPVGAIDEKQKAICHLCPDCTEMKPITSEQIIEMQESACTLACPLGISPQGYINLIKAGKKEEAYQLISDKNPLPSVCGYICHHPCEQVCKRGILVDEPMHIRAMKRYLGEAFLEKPLKPYPVLNDKQIAVIGAGPAGLTAAHWLSRRGYQVTVFEQSAEPGGMLLRGIPEFRLDKNVVRKEISKLREAGINIICNSKVDYPKDLPKLRKEFDKIVVG